VNAASISAELPVERSRFIGRRSHVRQVTRLLAFAQLVTLVGPGGSGKTRLALRVGRQRWRVAPDAVVYVDLATAATTDVRMPDGPALLVLDTCDVDIQASAQLIIELFAKYQGLQVLATAREPLGLPTEVVWRVPLMAVPDHHTLGTNQLLGPEACQLFLDRETGAFAERPSSTERAEAISSLCRNLDGLPLAVEIAAMRVAELGLDVLVARSTTNLLLDLPGRRDAPPRQASLRDTLEWSYARLRPREQHVLRRVSVYCGDWTQEMACAVCPELPPLEVTDALTQLLHRSLVHTTRAKSPRRYNLLQVTRLYGRELLRVHGELERAQQHMLEWCIALAESDTPEALNGAHAHRLEREHGNVRVALEWALASGQAELGLRLATAAFPLWYLRGLPAEGERWFERLLAQPLESVPPPTVGRARAWHMQLKMQRGDYVAVADQLERVLVEQRSCGSTAETGVMLTLVGNAMLWAGQLKTAGSFYEESEQLLAALSAPGVAPARYQAARVAWESGDVERAETLVQGLIGMVRSREPVMLARAHQLQALMAGEAGDAPAAQHYLDLAERALRRIDDVFGFVDLLTDRARVLLQIGQARAAHQAYINAAALARSIGARVRLVRAIEGVACAVVEQQPCLSVQLAAAAAASRMTMRAIAWPRDAARLEIALDTARGFSARWPDGAAIGLAFATYTQVWQLGSLLSESEAADMAIATIGSRPPTSIGDVPAMLTSREWEVAQLFANGASTRDIAERLTLSRETVRTHLDRATAKLGLHSRVQLAMWVAQSV